MAYRRFLLMLFISLIIMYGVMFLNVDSADHIYLSLTRLYMSILMVSPMAIVMLLLMKKMCTDRKLNNVIIIASIVVFGTTLYLLRSQVFINDQQYMRAMIPHHSSAILTSRHADIRDSAVKDLSESIIRSQEDEINQMKAMLEKMEK